MNALTQTGLTHTATQDNARFECSLDAAQRFSDAKPIFCFSPSALQAQAKLFLDNFPGEVAYAVKANPSSLVLETLSQSGITVFDVASTVEMEQVSQVCATPEFHYHNPVKSRAEIATAWHGFGCRRFSADSFEELAKIVETIGTPVEDKVEIAVRFCLPSQQASVHDFSSKFGLNLDGAIKLARKVVEHGFEPVLTFHPGSQCVEPAAWARHIKAAADIARSAGITLKVLNVGGGFPARYSGSRGLDATVFFAAIDKAVTDAFGEQRSSLECEPGRAMVANSFSLLTHVKLVRADTNEVFLNDGIYGGLLETAQAADLRPFHRVIRNGKPVDAAERQDFTVYGPTCDPLDVLPTKLRLPADLREGDIVEFTGIGAYGQATATRFNGYGTSETVLVDRLHRW